MQAQQVYLFRLQNFKTKFLQRLPIQKTGSPQFNCKGAFDTELFRVQNSTTKFLQRLHIEKTASPQF